MTPQMLHVDDGDVWHTKYTEPTAPGAADGHASGVNIDQASNVSFKETTSIFKEAAKAHNTTPGDVETRVRGGEVIRW